MKIFPRALALLPLAIALAACAKSDKAGEAASSDNVEMPAEEAMSGVEAVPSADPSATASEAASSDAADEAGSAAGDAASAAGSAANAGTGAGAGAAATAVDKRM